MHKEDNKKGITPVVTMIILILIAITIAVGAYTWVTQFQEQTQGKVEEKAGALDRRVSIQSIDCSNYDDGTGRIEVWFKNAGSTTLTLDPVNLLISRQGTEGADTELSRTQLSLYNSTLSEGIRITGDNVDFREAGSSANYIINTSNLASRNTYDLEFVFTDEGEMTLRERCEVIG